MKWTFALIFGFVLAGVAVASCGPEKKFCPSNPPNYNCVPPQGGGSGDMTGEGGSTGGGTQCDGGPHTIGADGSIVCTS